MEALGVGWFLCVRRNRLVFVHALAFIHRTHSNNENHAGVERTRHSATAVRIIDLGCATCRRTAVRRRSSYWCGLVTDVTCEGRSGSVPATDVGLRGGFDVAFCGCVPRPAVVMLGFETFDLLEDGGFEEFTEGTRWKVRARAR